MLQVTHAALFVLLSWLDGSQRHALTSILKSLVLAFQLLRCASSAQTRSPNLCAKKGSSRDTSTLVPQNNRNFLSTHAIPALAQEKHPDAKATCGNRSGGLCVPLKQSPRTRWRVFQIPLVKETEHATGDCLNWTEHCTHSPADHCRSLWIYFQPQQDLSHNHENHIVHHKAVSLNYTIVPLGNHNILNPGKHSHSLHMYFKVNAANQTRHP